jgi:hypothetical protein
LHVSTRYHYSGQITKAFIYAMLVIAVGANPTSLDLAVANCPGTSLLVVPIAAEGVAVCRDFHDVPPSDSLASQGTGAL